MKHYEVSTVPVEQRVVYSALHGAIRRALKYALRSVMRVELSEEIVNEIADKHARGIAKEVYDGLALTTETLVGEGDPILEEMKRVKFVMPEELKRRVK